MEISKDRKLDRLDKDFSNMKALITLRSMYLFIKSSTNKAFFIITT